ncbi:hypothetical protein [Campylobacter showae]|nr:hypothetical protein [Campylobacter showae]
MIGGVNGFNANANFDFNGARGHNLKAGGGKRSGEFDIKFDGTD